MPDLTTIQDRIEEQIHEARLQPNDTPCKKYVENLTALYCTSLEEQLARIEKAVKDRMPTAYDGDHVIRFYEEAIAAEYNQLKENTDV